METETSVPLLPLRDLADRHYGLIPCIAETYQAAARVCLDRHHQSPVQIDITTGPNQKTAKLEWEAADARTRAALNNEIDTTEAGAYACVIAAVEFSEGLVRRRAR